MKFLFNGFSENALGALPFRKFWVFLQYQKVKKTSTDDFASTRLWGTLALVKP